MNIYNILAKVLYTYISEKNLFRMISDYVGYNNILDNCGMNANKYSGKDRLSVISWINENHFIGHFDNCLTVCFIQSNAEIIKKFNLPMDATGVVYIDNNNYILRQYNKKYSLVKKDYTNNIQYIIYDNITYNCKVVVLSKSNVMFIPTETFVCLYDYTNGKLIKKINCHNSSDYFCDINTNSLIGYDNQSFYKIDINLNKSKIIDYTVHAFYTIKYIDNEHVIVHYYTRNIIDIVNLLDITKNETYILNWQFKVYNNVDSHIFGRYIVFIYTNKLIVYDLITHKEMHKIENIGIINKEDSLSFSPMGKNIFIHNNLNTRLIY